MLSGLHTSHTEAIGIGDVICTLKSRVGGVDGSPKTGAEATGPPILSYRDEKQPRQDAAEWAAWPGATHEVTSRNYRPCPFATTIAATKLNSLGHLYHGNSII